MVYAIAAELFVLEIDGVPGSVLAVEGINRPGFRITRHDRNNKIAAGNSIQRTISAFSVTFVRAATATCRSTLGSSCTTGSTVILPNIGVILSGRVAHDCFESRNETRATGLVAMRLSNNLLDD